MSAIRPFHLESPEARLDDLRSRLPVTRSPERETCGRLVARYPLAALQALLEHWADGYEWCACEDRLNRFGQFLTEIDGLDIHFLHVRSPHETALPLILTHGWPGSIVEFMEVIAPLTDPALHGGRAEDAFHVVVLSLPGYGFSGRPMGAGRGVERIGKAWAELMRRSGYRGACFAMMR